jgi:hypothetical protein
MYSSRMMSPAKMHLGKLMNTKDPRLRKNPKLIE